MLKRYPLACFCLAAWMVSAGVCPAQDASKPAPVPPAATADSGDSAWMLVSTALVMLMVPGLALFYGGMVRRKNILATMMQSMVCAGRRRRLLGRDRLRPGVRRPWITLGESEAACSASAASLVFLHGVKPDTVLPGTNIPILSAHALPGDVRDHHAGADQRRRGGAHPLQAVLPVPDPVGHAGLLPAGPLRLGDGLALGRTARRRHAAKSGETAVGILGARWRRSISRAARWSTSRRASPAWRPSWCCASGWAIPSTPCTPTAWC